jgi:hypothetical protein
MIVRFSTRVGALTMHGEAAVALLRAMGHSGTVPGAILAADLPAALGRLRALLATDAAARPEVEPDAWQVEADEDDARRPAPISLRTRAVPLLDMIETAIARDSDLMWERG